MTALDPRLEALGRALRALPLEPAPPTLCPRVMAAVQARLRSAAAVPPAWPWWASSAAVFAGLCVCGVMVTALHGGVAGTAVPLPTVPLLHSLRETALPLARALALVVQEMWLPLATMVVVAVTAVALLVAVLAATVQALVPGGATR